MKPTLHTTPETDTGTFVSQNHKKGGIFTYQIHIPPQCKNRECAILINHDGLNLPEANAMYRLAEEGRAPYTVTMGLLPGKLCREGETDGYGLRFDCYDIFDNAYGRMIIEEFIPELAQKYGLKISDSPDMHMISGGSSGGISSFNIRKGRFSWSKVYSRHNSSGNGF